MATYAVGDLQGCLSPLKHLLDQVNFDPSQDKLWCVGDLVNRGPQCLETLRFIHHLGESCISVLGNHDLHLMAVAFSDATLKPSDTLQKILDAADADELLQGLRQRPLMHYEQGYALVHAGIHPHWSIQQALGYAKEVEDVLRDEHSYRQYFAQMYGNHPALFKQELEGMDRLRAITNNFTRMRFCLADGRLDLINKKGLASAPEGGIPWFAMPNRVASKDKILFGHWAALEGSCNTANVYALDSGCVWGNKMTMMRLDDEQYFNCDCSKSQAD